MTQPLSDAALAQLFSEARTFNAFTDRAIDDATIKRLYELAKWGPTSMNSQPARFVFLRSPEAKARLLPALSPSNVEKTRSAPLCVLIAQDNCFQSFITEQFPVYDARPMFDANPELAWSTAFRGSCLQGAYLMLAARSLGLACGPMSGFDAEVVNQSFFPDGRWSVNFLLNLGCGDPSGNYPRGPRLPFSTACQLL